MQVLSSKTTRCGALVTIKHPIGCPIRCVAVSLNLAHSCDYQTTLLASSKTRSSHKYTETVQFLWPPLFNIKIDHSFEIHYQLGHTHYGQCHPVLIVRSFYNIINDSFGRYIKIQFVAEIKFQMELDKHSCVWLYLDIRSLTLRYDVGIYLLLEMSRKPDVEI